MYARVVTAVALSLATPGNGDEPGFAFMVGPNGAISQ
jgi:hypothetical protein